MLCNISLFSQEKVQCCLTVFFPSPIDPDTHIVCEPCASDSPVNGGFDPINGEVNRLPVTTIHVHPFS